MPHTKGPWHVAEVRDRKKRLTAIDVRDEEARGSAGVVGVAQVNALDDNWTPR